MDGREPSSRGGGEHDGESAGVCCGRRAVVCEEDVPSHRRAARRGSAACCLLHRRTASRRAGVPARAVVTFACAVRATGSISFRWWSTTVRLGVGTASVQVASIVKWLYALQAHGIGDAHRRHAFAYRDAVDTRKRSEVAIERTVLPHDDDDAVDLPLRTSSLTPEIRSAGAPIDASTRRVPRSCLAIVLAALSLAACGRAGFRGGASPGRWSEPRTSHPPAPPARASSASMP